MPTRRANRYRHQRGGRLLEQEKVDMLMGFFSSAQCVPVAARVEQMRNSCGFTTCIPPACSTQELQICLPSAGGRRSVWIMANAQIFGSLPNLETEFCDESVVSCLLIAGRLRTEDIFVVLAVEHAGGNAGGDPMNFFICSTRAATGTHCAMRRSHEHVDLFLLQQAYSLVDGDIGFALRVGIDRLDLVSLNAVFDVLVDHDLDAGVLQLRTAARERPVRSKITPILIFFSWASAATAVPSAAITANSPPNRWQLCAPT